MDRDKNTLVTVIMPAYNSEHYIEKSMHAVLNQSYKNLELIVINDCSKLHAYFSLYSVQNYKLA